MAVPASDCKTWSVNDGSSEIKIVSYNVMSTRKAGRLEMILTAFAWATVVCLQGTRHKQASEGPLTSYWIGAWYIIDSGYHEKYGNKHAGLIVAIHTTYMAVKFLKQVCWPDDTGIQGRIIGCRICRGTCDFLVLNLYVPPWSGKVTNVMNKICNWTRKCLRQAPVRTTPVACGDLNAKFGIKYGNPVPSPCIGQYRQQQNGIGDALLEIFESFRMLIVNSTVIQHQIKCRHIKLPTPSLAMAPFRSCLGSSSLIARPRLSLVMVPFRALRNKCKSSQRKMNTISELSSGSGIELGFFNPVGD